MVSYGGGARDVSLVEYCWVVGAHGYMGLSMRYGKEGCPTVFGMSGAPVVWTCVKCKDIGASGDCLGVSALGVHGYLQFTDVTGHEGRLGPDSWKQDAPWEREQRSEP
ncbi:hypothetical protein NDU88_010191 [Pleurodeles waltl]|uniref:Uncharacterized protein n=1 Tax=Pleurodeles waltl TaxID=8319 RepID=A0AAV7PXB8_PLEWA|nr:hypothetical protein NDU88_010191 [Pleurodeles waltl]